jgi:hypothetical protein
MVQQAGCSLLTFTQVGAQQKIVGLKAYIKTIDFGGKAFVHLF